MILTELGLTFERDGADWRCIEIPQIRALGTGGYQIDGHPEAIKDLTQAVDQAKRLMAGPDGDHDLPPRARRRRKRARALPA